MRKAGIKSWLIMAVAVVSLLAVAAGISYWARTSDSATDTTSSHPPARLDDAEAPAGPPVYDTLAPYKGGRD